MASIKINTDKLKDYLSKNGIAYSTLSADMGRSASFVSNIFAKGYMSGVGYSAMCRVLGVEPGTFVAQEAAPIPDVYRLNLVYSDNKVLVQLMRGEEVVTGAYAFIKDQSFSGFCQAISYAAHMMYKFAEQDDFNKEETA